MRAPGEPHGLALEDFHEEVHSFEFWFQAVEGYLSGQPYGHRPALPAPEISAAERDALITVLCNYCVGETAALDGASGMIGFAPNRHAKIFLATQVADEARHLEVLLRRLRSLGVDDPEAEVERRVERSLLNFKQRLLCFVHGKDWEAAVFAQNVILEAMEFTVFRAHAETADPVTRQILEGIIKDERRHMGFGENDLGRRIAATPHLRARLGEIRRELDGMVLESFEKTLDTLDLARSQRPELGRRYLATVERLGFAP